jgi:hypothetical protein
MESTKLMLILGVCILVVIAAILYTSVAQKLSLAKLLLAKELIRYSGINSFQFHLIMALGKDPENAGLQELLKEWNQLTDTYSINEEDLKELHYVGALHAYEDITGSTDPTEV